MKSKYFINLNTLPPRELPGILSAPYGKEFYRAKLQHAEVDHCNKPQVRRSDTYYIHHHDHFHFILVTGGSGRFFIDGKFYPTSLGQAFFTGPRQPHQFMNFGKDTTRYAEVTFEMVDSRGKILNLHFHELLSIWINQSFSPLVQTTLSAVVTRLLEGKIEQLVAVGKAQASDLEINQALSEILMLVALHAFRRTAPAMAQPLDAIRDSIRAHYQEKLSLSALAREAHLTPNYLSRRFRQLYGQGPIDYQIDLRIRSACELLKTVNDTLDEIAAAVGFQDTFYFSRLFKSRTGEAPAHFRRRHARGKA